MKSIEEIMKPTKHKADCKMVFGRKDASCPRCQELLAGMKPREWVGFKLRKQEEARRIGAIRTHDCKKSGCMSVCVAFDY